MTKKMRERLLAVMRAAYPEAVAPQELEALGTSVEDRHADACDELTELAVALLTRGQPGDDARATKLLQLLPKLRAIFAMTIDANGDDLNQGAVFGAGQFIQAGPRYLPLDPHDRGQDTLRTMIASLAPFLRAQNDFHRAGIRESRATELSALTRVRKNEEEPGRKRALDARIDELMTEIEKGDDHAELVFPDILGGHPPRAAGEGQDAGGVPGANGAGAAGDAGAPPPGG